MAFSLGSLLGHWFHLRQNQLGHSALGNAIVGAVDNTLDPALFGAVSGATGGLVAPQATPPTTATPSTLETVIDQEIALFLGAALAAHNEAAVHPVVLPTPPSRSVVPSPASPVTEPVQELEPQTTATADTEGLHPLGAGSA